jgi:DNA-binding XRE family transcriptional regulator
MPPADDKRPIQQAVRELRQHCGLTQVELAKMLKRSPYTIVRYEGEMPPAGNALVELIAVARAAEREDLAKEFLDAAHAQIQEMFRFPEVDLEWGSYVDTLATAGKGLSKREAQQKVKAWQDLLREILADWKVYRPQETPFEKRLRAHLDENLKRLSQAILRSKSPRHTSQGSRSKQNRLPTPTPM